MIRLGLAIFALVSSFSVEAGMASADIGIDVSIEPPNPILPGTEGTISVTIANSGPDMGTVLFGWSATPNGTGFGFPPLAFPGPFSGPCSISPVGLPGPGDNFGFWVTYDVLPGENRTCNFGFRVLQTATVSQLARWNVSVFDGDGNFADDPNLSNNEAGLLLVFVDLPIARPVPTLSRTSLLVFIMLVGVAAFLVRARTFGNFFETYLNDIG